MLLLDTGVIYALADADDEWHRPVREYLRRTREVLMAPVTVVPEVTYLLHSRLGTRAERKFVESLAAGEIVLEHLTAIDLRRSAELLAGYPALGFVDTSVVAVAERLRLPMIATTDRRHFSRVRPKHRSAFELVP